MALGNPAFTSISFADLVLSSIISQRATISTPGICVIRSTAPGPRIPNPIKATRTVGNGAVAKRKTSVCPLARFGALVLIICADELAHPRKRQESTSNLKILVFIIELNN